MRLTVPHYYDFGPDRHLLGADRFGPNDWDRLRTEGSGLFRFPADHGEWRRLIETSPWQERRARALAGWIDRLDVESVASYGAGPGIVEAWLRELVPEVRLTLTDVAPLTVERLTEHFGGVDVRTHDFCRDRPIAADLQVFNGVDTELNDRQWRDVLRRFANETVLLFPNITFGVRAALGEAWCRRPGRRPMRAGWWRTKGRFDDLARTSHDARRLAGGRAGNAWLLEPR